MKIQKCTICDKPYFQEPKTTTDYAFDFDPTACPQCNENARQNSVPAINNKGKENKKGQTLCSE